MSLVVSVSKAIGADDDTAELISNVAGLAAGGKSFADLFSTTD